MIDFRYHLISIVAVLLALAIGIVTGSGFLGGPILERLKSESDTLIDRNRELRGIAGDLDRRLRISGEALARYESGLVQNTLSAEQILVILFDGSDGELTGEVAGVIEEADGRVVSTITISQRFGFEDPADRVRLSEIMTARTEVEPLNLREEVARALGDALADLGQPDEVRGSNGDARALLDELQDAGLISIDNEVEGQLVPPAPAVVVEGGAETGSPFAVGDFAIWMLAELSEANLPLLAAESSTSQWGMVEALRDDGETQDSVWTVDQAETPEGRISVALALSRALGRPAEHFGTDTGADEVVPEPAPSQ